MFGRHHVLTIFKGNGAIEDRQIVMYEHHEARDKFDAAVAQAPTTGTRGVRLRWDKRTIARWDVADGPDGAWYDPVWPWEDEPDDDEDDDFEQRMARKVEDQPPGYYSYN